LTRKVDGVAVSGLWEMDELKERDEEEKEKTQEEEELNEGQKK